MQYDRPLVGECSHLDIEPEMVLTIREDGMFIAVSARHDRQPGCEVRWLDRVSVTLLRWNDGDGESCRIEIGTPDNPCVRGLDLRAFGESESPTVLDRRSPGRPPTLRPVSQCWPWYTRRRTQGRGAATPTLGQPDRCPAAGHKAQGRASYQTG